MQTQDNLRKFRRDLAGRGVNYREALVDGKDAGNDILVPLLKDGDEIVALQNLSTLVEMTLAMSRVAYTTFFASNKLFRVTMNKATQAGPGSKMWFEVVPAAEGELTHVTVTAPTAAQLTTHATMKADDRIVTVHAHVSSGTTIDLTAAGLAVAVNIDKEASKVVTASLPTGTGADAVTAFAPNNIGTDDTTESTAAQTGFLLSQGPAAASVDFNSGQPADADITYTAVEPGAAGNDLDVEYIDDADLDGSAGEQPYVVLNGNVIEVYIDDTVSLASEVVSAVNAAKMPVTAALTAGEDGSGAVTVAGPVDLVGGRDEGRIVAVEGSTTEVVRVVWIGRA